MSSAAKVNLSKEELRQIYFRWLFGSQLGWNYERMQGLGYTYTAMPLLKKLYPNDQDMRDALKMHLQFFNTEPSCGHLVVGAALAMEAAGGKEARDVVAGIKTGLMGPFAAIGDTIFGVIYGTIFGALAAYMAIQGSPVGVFLWIAAAFCKIALRYYIFFLGYDQGVKLVTTMSSRLTYVTDAASILGITVIGALISTVVRAKTKLEFKMGDVTMPLQDILDNIMPALIPVLLVAFVYWLLGRKGMNSNKVIFIVIGLAIALSLLGIF